MWCTPTKQGTGDILGNMSFCVIIRSTLSAFQYEHHFGIKLKFDTKMKFILLLFEIWTFVYDFKQFLWKCDFEILTFRISYSYSFGFDRLHKNAEFFCGKVFEIMKISQKLQGGDRRHIKVRKKTKMSNWQMSYFSPLCQLQSSISQNRPVWLVPCFVGVHHICISW